MDRRSTAWISAAYVACFAVAAWLAFRAITPPEAQLWDELMRPPFRVAFLSPSSWSNWIYAVLAKRTVGLFRLSEFSLRLPALLACAVYLASLPRRPLFILAAVAPVAAGLFSTASGLSIALALCAAGTSPLLLGFAIAAAPVVALPVLAFAIARSVERVAIPAIATAFILSVVPFSHAERRPAPSIGSREVAAMRTDLLPWRGHAVELGAPPDYLPVLRFYKDRYRERRWTIGDRFDGSRPGVVVFNH